MKYRIYATYFVEAPNWDLAEKQVEARQADPDVIESKPAGNEAKDYVAFGIAKKIYEEHTKLYFSSGSEDEYEREKEKLIEKTTIWLAGILDELILQNESSWE